MNASSEIERVAPFDLGSGPRTALLVHGFTGTPFEMRFLGEHLAANGFRAIGPQLPGHRLDPHELERCNASDWINEARAALLALPADRKVVLAGLSMGALVASILAAEHPERVAGLALCAPALEVFHRRRRTALIMLASAGLLPVRFLKKGPHGFVDEAMGRQLPRLQKAPVRAYVEFDRVRALARLALPNVRAPAIIIYSPADRTVPPSAARSCARLLGGRATRLVQLERSSHVITLDVERARVAQEIEQFFRAVLPEGG